MQFLVAVEIENNIISDMYSQSQGVSTTLPQEVNNLVFLVIHPVKVAMVCVLSRRDSQA